MREHVGDGRWEEREVDCFVRYVKEVNLDKIGGREGGWEAGREVGGGG